MISYHLVRGSSTDHSLAAAVHGTTRTRAYWCVVILWVRYSTYETEQNYLLTHHDRFPWSHAKSSFFFISTFGSVTA